MMPIRLSDGNLAARLREGALALYEERGYENTTADDIAATVGVSRRSLFRYFPDVSDVIFSDHFLQMQPTVAERLKHGSSRDLAPISFALEAVVEGISADVAFARRRARIVRETHVLQDRETVWFDQYRALVAEYLGVQYVPPTAYVPANVFASAAVAAARFASTAWLLGEGDDPVEAFEGAFEALSADFLRQADIAPGETRLVVVETSLTAEQLLSRIQRPD